MSKKAKQYSAEEKAKIALVRHQHSILELIASFNFCEIK